jgi:glycolate oxidase
MDSSLEYFSGLLGEQNIIQPSSREKIQDYLKDMAEYPSEPLFVLRPDSTVQVSKIVAKANETRTPIVARGAGTSLTGASSAHGSIVVDFTRMKKILKIDTVNWYAYVEAGVVLEDLNDELKKFGFFFPPDPGSTPWCTIGGAIAENSGGMKCFKYGTVKDWVLSLRVVLADGSIVKFGEPLPKNRVGYDFVHLMCGSEGTLGLITEAWVKITPIPPKNSEHKRLLVFFDNWASAGKAIQKIRENRIQPVLLEFMDRETMHSVNTAFDLGIPEDEAILFIETDSRLNELLKICGECGSTSNYVAKDEADEERLYNARMLNYMGLKSLNMALHTEDVVVPIDKLVDYLEFVKLVSKKYGLRIPTGGHAGDGNVHPSILYDENSKESREAADLAFADICNYAIEVGGSVTGEHGIGEQKIAFAEAQLLKSNGKEVLELMRHLKKQWDPNNILNPGKFFRLDN